MSLSVKLKKDQIGYLKSIAKNKNKDIDYVVAEIIDEYLEKLLDDELFVIAEERLANMRSGKSKTIPYEEVLKENGLSD